MLKISTGLRNAMLASAAMQSSLNLGVINIYAGNVQPTADAALDSTNVLLCTITNNSTTTGLTLGGGTGAVSAGILGKTSTEVWSGVNVASGVATMYRHVAAGDTGALSTTAPRIQGQIATAGSDMNLTNTTLSIGATQTLSSYSVALPTL